MYLDTSRAIWEPSGQVIRYQGTLVDVTERREMERQLRHKKNFSPRLLESLLPELILVIDTEGTALSVHIHAI
jgi:hypothetical protein